MSHSEQPSERPQLSEALSDATSASSGSDQLFSGRSESGLGLDSASPPTSIESEGVDPFATSTSAVAAQNLPQRSAQPQRSSVSRSNSRPAANNDEVGIELGNRSHAEREVRPESDNQSRSEHRSSTSSSSTRTEDTWLSFLTGTVSDSVKRPSSNWALSLLLLHYLVFVIYSIGSFAVQILQYWLQRDSGNPNPAEETLVRMQKLFGEQAHGDAAQAHKDALKVLSALSTKDDADAQWESIFDKFIEVISTCINSANETLTGSKCADLWKSAKINSTQEHTPDVAPSYGLQKRKLEKIRQAFDKHDLAARSHGMADHRGSANAWTILLCSVLLLACVVVLVVFRQRLLWSVPSMFKRIRQKRHRHDPSIAEKGEDDNPHASEAVAVSSSIGIGLDSIATRRVGVPDAAHLPNNMWELAAQGRLEETRRRREEESGFDVNKVHPRYGTLLAAAARSGKIDVVSYVLTLGVDLRKEGGQYHNALQSGASSGDSLVVRKLLDAGAKDCSVGGYFGTALNAAAERAGSEVLIALLGSTSNPARWVNEPGGLHGTALIAAASRGQLKMVLDLLAYGADIDGTNDSGETALHAAASANHMQIAEMLLEKGAEKNLLSATHGTALHVACRGKYGRLALMLVQRGVCLNISDHSSRTVLHEASKSGLSVVVEAMLAKDTSMINAQDANGNTALHDAAIGGHAGITSLLIKHNIDVSLGDRFKAQALFRAAGCQHPEVVQILLEEGNADPNATDSFNQTALHGPAETEDVRVQRYLIKAKANVNARGAWNRTPLHEACNMARYTNIELLLSCPDIDVNVIDDGQTTPLCRSLCSTDGRYQDKCIDKRVPMMMLDHKDIDCEDFGNGVEADVRKDIDVNLCHGLAIQEAARRNLTDVVKKMVKERNGNIHLPGGKYGGVLQAAAMGGDIELLSFILKCKANPNLQGGEYGTPLAAAAAYGNAPAVKLLIESGADASVRGVGRYGSAFNSVCRALKVEEEGQAKLISLTTQIEEILRNSGADSGISVRDVPHLKDRWQLMPNGYGWNAAGEL